MQYYHELFSYDSAVNNKLFVQLQNSPLVLGKAKETLAHIIATQQVWLSRLKKQPLDGITFWPEYRSTQLKKNLKTIGESFRNYLENLSNKELEQALHYTNSSGKKFENPIRDILSHVIIHGEHHRGQIAKFVRKEGEEPLNTDYITYIRSHS